MLGSTGAAGRPESYFRAADESTWADRWRLTRHQDGSLNYQDFARAALAAGQTDNLIFGARIMWGTLEEVVTKLGECHPDLAGRALDLLQTAFGPLQFVHLWREDTLAQAVSWARAEQTGFWHPGDVAGHQSQFDADQIELLVRTIKEHNNAWRVWFTAQQIRPYEVRYEDLTADVEGTLRGLLEFLDLDFPAAVAPGTRLQGDELNADWIARYRQEREARSSDHPD
jgi:LPS sulfotransferase NodH